MTKETQEELALRAIETPLKIYNAYIFRSYSREEASSLTIAASHLCAALTIQERLDQIIALLKPPVVVGIHATDNTKLEPGPAHFVRLNPNGHPCIASAIEDGFKVLAETMRDIPNAIREGNQT